MRSVFVGILPWLLASLFVSSAHANVYVPKAELVGETVLVKISKENAEVEAVYGFNEGITRDAKVLYFPIFGVDGMEPVGVLATAGLEITVNEKNLGAAHPCAAPRSFSIEARGCKVFWYSADLDFLDAIANDGPQLMEGPLTVRVRYIQPLIGSHFYYLPVIPGDRSTLNARNWRFQMQARNRARPVELASTKNDREHLGDAVLIYMRDGELVDLK